MMNSTENNSRDLLEKTKIGPKFFRIDAMLKLANSSRSLEALKEIQAMESDKDPDISAVSKEVALKIKSRLFSLSINVPDKKGIFGVVLEEVGTLLDFIRTSPEKVPEDQICSAAAFLARFGNHSDSKTILSWLEKADFKDTFFLLEALRPLAPKEIEDNLSTFLKSPNSLIRSQALLVQHQINVSDSVANLSKMLLSNERDERIVGLKTAQHFQFSEIRELILNVLEKESDPEILNMAGNIILETPQVESALDLLNLMNSLPKEKKEIFNSIFLNLAQALGKNKILSPEEATPKALLKRWQKEKSLICLKNIEDQVKKENKVSEKVEKWLTQNSAVPEVRDFIQKLSTNPKTEEVAQKIIPTVKNSNDNLNESSEEALSQETPDPNNLNNLDESKKIAFISNLKEVTFPKFADCLREQLNHGSVEVKCAVFSALREFSKSTQDLEIAQKALSEEVDPKVKTAAFLLLQKRYFSRLLPSLKGLISSDIHNKIRAFSFPLEIDPDKSFSEAIKLYHSENELEKGVYPIIHSSLRDLWDLGFRGKIHLMDKYYFSQPES
ncbi:MAG: hypothetical protein HQM08_00935 [Candidatus Riflebacteria bacterium]|nr:hypothetical protein [Candidatus Riflebacteria bacterium]